MKPGTLYRLQSTGLVIVGIVESVNDKRKLVIGWEIHTDDEGSLISFMRAVHPFSDVIELRDVNEIPEEVR